MEILRITEETASQASFIYASSWKAAYRGIVPSEYLDALSAERWTPFLRDSARTGFLLRADDAFVATSSISPARDQAMSGWGEIISIYVLPQHIQKGYGKALFSHAVEQLYRDGYDKLYLWVLKDNLRARAFYEKNGFFPNGEEAPITIGGQELTEVRYVHHAT